MEGFYAWVKNITCYLIFVTVLMNVLPKKTYEKYMRLFAGMVLILLVLKPLTAGLRLEERIAYYYQSISFTQEANLLDREASRLQEDRMERMFAQYREAMAMDVARMVESAGFTVKTASVEVREDSQDPLFGAVTSISVILLSQEAQETLSIDRVEIEIQPVDTNSEGDTAAATMRQREEHLADSREINRLRRQIAGYYNLEEEYVEIKMENE